MKKLLILLLLPLLLFGGETLFQISTIDALLTGLYDGFITLEDLSKKGDFGIGTYHQLDGEMIVMNGVFYQVKADGKVYTPELSTTSPFASISHFEAEDSITLKTISSQDFFEVSSEFFPSWNIFYAVKMTGKFSYIKTRSVPKQPWPYPPLAEIAAEQPTFEYHDIEGTIVGFRCPPYVKSINVPGFHLHFLSKDKTVGGHLLNFHITKAQMEIDCLHNFELQVPKDDKFYKTNLHTDKSKELKKVEK